MTAHPELICGHERVFGSQERRQEQARLSRDRYQSRWGVAQHYCLYFGPKTQAGDLSDALETIVAGARHGHSFTLLLHRRLTEPRIRATSKTSDILILALLWLQLLLGLATIPLSAQHLDGSMMIRLAEWGQRIVTFRGGAVELLEGAGWIFKTHLFLGMTIFLVFPFTRLVHVGSGFAAATYVVRAWQLVRPRG